MMIVPSGLFFVVILKLSFQLIVFFKNHCKGNVFAITITCQYVWRSRKKRERGNLNLSIVTVFVSQETENFVSSKELYVKHNHFYRHSCSNNY